MKSIQHKRHHKKLFAEISSKLTQNYGGWYCACCNSFRCHPRKMKKLANRIFRRKSKQRITQCQ